MLGSVCIPEEYNAPMGALDWTPLGVWLWRRVMPQPVVRERVGSSLEERKGILDRGVEA
jgi:hypothetical protein